MLNVGWWIHSEFKIAHSKFRSMCGVCVSNRSWGVLILDFGFLMDWGEEKPNGEFWMLNGGLVKFERRNGKLAFGRCWNEEGC